MKSDSIRAKANAKRIVNTFRAHKFRDEEEAYDMLRHMIWRALMKERNRKERNREEAKA